MRAHRIRLLSLLAAMVAVVVVASGCVAGDVGTGEVESSLAVVGDEAAAAPGLDLGEVLVLAAGDCSDYHCRNIEKALANNCPPENPTPKGGNTCYGCAITIGNCRQCTNCNIDCEQHSGSYGEGQTCPHEVDWYLRSSTVSEAGDPAGVEP